MNKKLQVLLPLEQMLPSTRYVGSKRKLVQWIWENIGHLDFNSYLEPFGGTGSLAYLAKIKGKEVTYNDFLRFNYMTGLALIENSNTILNFNEINSIIMKLQNLKYSDFIQENFDGLYFTKEENKWLDIVATNIGSINNIFKKALATYALCQACIIKRPYNLFHRANLYMRTAKVNRSFGNLTSWNTPFEVMFKRFATEANNYVFSNGKKNKALNLDAMDISEDYDLVYIDSPYMSPISGGTDYKKYYHFLEGLSRYDEWKQLIDYDSMCKKMKPYYSIWLDKYKIEKAFDYLFDKFQKSIIVVSYRTGGIPSYVSLKRLLRKYKSEVILREKYYRYALAKTHGYELLFIAQ